MLASMALMQPQYQEIDTVSVPDNVLSASPSLAPSSQEPYYSNHDIAILHAVITAAQELLDHSATPKPLPAAALFKAYDEVLPQHGIDPDSDHHLSTLVFRVGGEQGDSTLSQKFQAILGRMGIVLEFGDNTTTSLHSQRSHSISPAPSHSSRPYIAQTKGSVGDNALYQRTRKSNIISQPDTSVFATLPAEAVDVLNDFDNEGEGTVASSALEKLRNLITQHASNHNHDDPVVGSERPLVELQAEDVLPMGNNESTKHSPIRGETATQYIPPHNVRQATLALAIDRWRAAMSQQRKWRADNSAPNREDDMGSQVRTHDKDEDPILPEGNNCSHVDVQTNPSTVTRVPDMNKVENKKHQESHVVLDDFGKESPHVVPLDRGNITPNNSINTKVDTSEQRHEQLLSRAARAREIYLASKVFNHWADRTATRLEREGVARRHMVRFRCFRGWSQAPSSRAPVIDQLRTITAVQKLQRAVAYQEEQLSIAASAIAQSYRLKVALRIFEQWTRHLMINVSRQRSIQRTKSNVVTAWTSQATENTSIGHAVLKRKGYHDKLGALSKWRYQARLSARRLGAARQVGALRLSFDHLGEWWDQAEVKRRALACQESSLMKAARSAFDIWNLRVRVQAFRWRNEYLSVTRALHKWQGTSVEDRCRQDKAARNFEKQCISKFLDALVRSNESHAQLDHLDSRARLFIVATRVMPVLDVAVEKRKTQVKETLRRYLMMRYTEVSSARKKRKFYGVLDHWRAMTAHMHEKIELAAIVETDCNALRLQNAVAKWRKRTRGDARLQLITSQYHRQAWLATWRDFTQEHEQQDMQCWESWATGKQRQYLKEWSISSLQRSGQAHTAIMVQQKYYGEKRNRTFHQWRQASGNDRDAPLGLDMRFTPKPESFGGHRNGWRTLSARRHLLKESLHERDITTGLVETPTRWTGVPMSMSFALSSRLMPPVRETDEESVLFSGTEEADLPKSPKKAGLPSTTPRAPVPAHLELDTLPSHDSKSRRFGSSVTMRSVRIKAESPSKGPSTYLPGVSTPRSRMHQPRDAFQRPSQEIAPRHSGKRSEGMQAPESKPIAPIDLSRSSRVQLRHSMSAVTSQPPAPPRAAAGFRSPWPQHNGQRAHSKSSTISRTTKQGRQN